MHLVILTQYYPPEIGAPQSRLCELARAFRARGHDVTVLTAMPNYPGGRVHDGYGGLLREEVLEGVRVIRGYVYPTQSARMVPRLTSYGSFALSSAIAGTMRLPRADFLLVESPPLFLTLSGIWLARRLRARLVVNVSDLWPESAVHLGVLRRDSRAYRAAARLEAFAYRSAWLVTGQSEEIVADVRSRFPGCPTYHLSNGVDTHAFGPSLASDAARATLGGAGACVVLYAGLHGLAQGLESLLDAVARLGAGAGVRLVLVGDGVRKAALQADAAARGLGVVDFLPARPRREVAPLLASADVLVVPLGMAIPGAVPSKIYEAMASGRPLVLAADGEAADIVRRHEAGIVVPPADVGAIAEALARLRDDPAERARLGANGRRAAERHFDRADIGERFVRWLEASEGRAPGVPTRAPARGRGSADASRGAPAPAGAGMRLRRVRS